MALSKVAVIVIFCVFFLNFSQITSTSVSELKKSILDQILPKHANDVLIGPGNGTDGTTEVVVYMHIIGIDELNDKNMDFSVRVYLRQLWKDEKLKYDSKGQFKHIVLNDIDLIWTPDTFFLNEKRGQAYDITHPNVFLKIFPDGTVLCSRKLSITVSCPMNLKKFPFDTQECQLKMGTYGSTIDDVNLIWREYVPITVSRSLHLAPFNLEKFLTFLEYYPINSGQYSILTLTFHFSRSFGHYLYNVFMPCTMLVILSWIPFWLSNKQLTSRLLMSLGPLLIGVVIISRQNKHRAILSYSTYMDCFTGTCLTFIFASVIETVIIHLLSERKIKNERKDCTLNGNAHREENKILTTAKAWISKIPCKIDYVDIGARFMMPVMYGIFCIIYFTTGSNQSEET